MMLLGVAVEQTAYHFDRLYTYFVPAGMQSPSVGCRVVVPFGRGNAHRNGFVVTVTDSQPPTGVKPILEVVDLAPLLSQEMVELAKYMKEHTFCALYDALKTMLPAGIHMQMCDRYRAGKVLPQGESPSVQAMVTALTQSEASLGRDRLLAAYDLQPADLDRLVAKGVLILEKQAFRRMGDATVKTVRLIESDQTPVLTQKQQEVFDLLQQVGAATVKEVCYFTGVTPAVVNALVKKGIAEFSDVEVFRTPKPAAVRSVGELTLSSDQQAAFDTLQELLKKPEPAAALLYGVTGSGKTSVYLRLIDEARKKDAHAGVIVMVPEISLTPQTVAIFQGRYGEDVAVFHSRLSLGERMDEWKRVHKGLAHIVVGTRSAVFAPFEKISLIVMDEEQEHTYKSESSPRFHARDIARFRAAYHGALLLLASATPSVESFAKAMAGTYTLCRLPNRYGKAVLPQVTALDMRQEVQDGNISLISNPLLERLRKTMDEGKQSILLLNRRGYHTYVSCGNCGQVQECPECSISLTYHRDNHRLMCHYCGYSVPMPDTCPSCGGEILKMSGIGTQKAEETIKLLLPDARVLRMDADTTMSRFAHSEKLDAFAAGNYDILLGTQMVAKGLDFENVALVGVLNADQMLHNNDYRAYERGFSLLTQVVGRAGRSSSAGQAVIQTSEPDHDLIELARRQDYESFYNQEIALRKLMEYPPFCDICLIGFVGTDANKTKEASLRMLAIIKEEIARAFSDVTLKILGPAPAQVAKISGKYRYRMIIKCRNTRSFRALVGQCLCRFGNEKGWGSVTAYADMNPEGII